MGPKMGDYLAPICHQHCDTADDVNPASSMFEVVRWISTGPATPQRDKQHAQLGSLATEGFRWVGAGAVSPKKKVDPLFSGPEFNLLLLIADKTFWRVR